MTNTYFLTTIILTKAKMNHSAPPAVLLMSTTYITTKVSFGFFYFSPIVVIQSLGHVQLFATPWSAARQASRSFAISCSLFKFMSIGLVMLSNHLILCGSLLLFPSIFLSFRDFSSEYGLRVRWPNYWSFGLSISPLPPTVNL